MRKIDEKDVHLPVEDGEEVTIFFANGKLVGKFETNKPRLSIDDNSTA